MTPKDFKKVNNLPIGLGMGKLEYEEFACIMLNWYIDNDIKSFDIPYRSPFEIDNMVRLGFLNKHEDKKYTFTKKSIGLLWIRYSKD